MFRIMSHACWPHDLQHAGIPRQTAKGKVDFHALRTTYINLVIASGATVPEAQALARHRTAALTIGVYGRSEDRRLQQLIDTVAGAILPEAERAYSVHAQAVGDEQTQRDQGDTGGSSPLIRLISSWTTTPTRLHTYTVGAMRGSSNLRLRKSVRSSTGLATPACSSGCGVGRDEREKSA